MIHFGPCRATAEAEIFVQLAGVVSPFSDGSALGSPFEYRDTRPGTGTAGAQNVRGHHTRQTKRITGIDFDRCERRGYYWIRSIVAAIPPIDPPTDPTHVTAQIHLADRNGNIIQADILSGVTGDVGGSYPTIPPVGEVALTVVDGVVTVEDGEAGVFQSDSGLDMRALVLIEEDDFSLIMELTAPQWVVAGQFGDALSVRRLSMCD